jgi:hypothetical protein
MLKKLSIYDSINENSLMKTEEEFSLVKKPLLENLKLESVHLELIFDTEKDGFKV